MHAARTSKLASSMAILGLILVSALLVIVVNSSVLVNPTLPIQGGNRNGPSQTGTLTVRLLSNQNQTDKFANPSSIPRTFPVVGKSILVSQATNSSNPFGQVLVTDSRGNVSQNLAPGPYLVSLRDEALDINVPVTVSPGNETTVTINVDGTAHSLIYSEESGVHLAAGGAQSIVFVELRADVPVANVSDGVILEVHGAAPRSGYLVNATVISGQSPALGTQWLELGASGTVDPVNAASIVLTTWTYSAFIIVRPIGPFVVANA